MPSPSVDNACIRVRADAWIVCVKEERKIPTQNLKNYQRIKEEKQKKNNRKREIIGTVRLVQEKTCNCKSVRVNVGIVLLCLIV